MNCIYCHNHIYCTSSHELGKKTCEKCHVDYIVRAPGFTDPIQAVELYYYDHYTPTSYRIGLYPEIKLTTFNMGGKYCLSLNRLFWVTPSNMEEYISRFSKLVIIS